MMRQEALLGMGMLLISCRQRCYQTTVACALVLVIAPMLHDDNMCLQHDDDDDHDNKKWNAICSAPAQAAHGLLLALLSYEKIPEKQLWTQPIAQERSLQSCQL